MTRMICKCEPEEGSGCIFVHPEWEEDDTIIPPYFSIDINYKPF